jgi:hypothetical protein
MTKTPRNELKRIRAALLQTRVQFEKLSKDSRQLLAASRKAILRWRQQREGA